MIDRILDGRLRQVAELYPVVTLTGPRQAGKSTLCRQIFGDRPMVSLEDIDVRTFAQQDPRGFLAQFPKGAVLDEIQRVPDLLSYLQGIVDRNPQPGRFVITGSQNLALSNAVAQSLAGRTAILRLLPCGWDEVQRFESAPTDLAAAMFTGGYPRILDRQLPPSQWLGDYVTTYVERDVRQLLNITDLATFQTFIGLCAARTAQLFNASSLGADAGITHATAKAWLSLLEASYIAQRLRPYYHNLGKRLTKAAKLHFFDSGLLCFLLGIRSPDQLVLHPLRGAIFETWVCAELHKVAWHTGINAEMTFFRDQKGHEVDLVVAMGPVLTAIESKSGATIAADFFDQLRYFANFVGNDKRVQTVRSVLVYGGGTPQRRQDVDVVPWNAISAALTPTVATKNE